MTRGWIRNLLDKHVDPRGHHSSRNSFPTSDDGVFLLRREWQSGIRCRRWRWTFPTARRRQFAKFAPHDSFSQLFLSFIKTSKVPNFTKSLFRLATELYPVNFGVSQTDQFISHFDFYKLNRLVFTHKGCRYFLFSI